jgi:two-component system phosphate regulon sensor histidine kinase PhoR
LDETFRSPEILRAFGETLETGHRTIATATAHVLRDPRPRHFSISVAPLKETESQPAYGAIGIFHDVTELKQAEQIRIEFVANASHELRTPLTSIKGYVDTLRSDLGAGRTDEATQFLEVVARNVDRLMSLVSDLLDLSAIESGAELKKTRVSAREVTEAALRQLEAKRAQKRQEIAAHYGIEAVEADAGRLEQVILNLVQNAIKYIPEGKRIDVFWEPGEGGGARLRVKDNGPGISLEHQSRLFERFYRVDAGRSRDLGGTGLGLAIVKHIVLKHGGDASLKSRPGEGAEFICTFPGRGAG